MEDVIKNELEEDTDIDTEDASNDEVEDIEDLDDEFEFDENGDIIIPDEGDDQDDKNDDEAEKKQDENGEESEDSENKEETDEKPEVVEPADAQPDEKDQRIASLERELKKLRSQSKDTLAKLGVETDDVMAGLVKLAAEAEETTPEEYLKKREEAVKNEEARDFMRKAEFEKKMKADLAEVQSAYPETRKYNSVLDFPNIKRFGELRDSGLTPKEAYIAAHPDSVRESVAAATKKQSLADTKNHLKTNVPKGSKDTSLRMSKKELGEYRELFPELTDKERVALYRQTMKK